MLDNHNHVRQSSTTLNDSVRRVEIADQFAQSIRAIWSFVKHFVFAPRLRCIQLPNVQGPRIARQCPKAQSLCAERRNPNPRSHSGGVDLEKTSGGTIDERISRLQASKTSGALTGTRRLRTPGYLPVEFDIMVVKPLVEAWFFCLGMRTRSLL
jgi:hypothetical protein